jgi:hypothetical protein
VDEKYSGSNSERMCGNAYVQQKPPQKKLMLSHASLPSQMPGQRLTKDKTIFWKCQSVPLNIIVVKIASTLGHNKIQLDMLAPFCKNSVSHITEKMETDFNRWVPTSEIVTDAGVVVFLGKSSIRQNSSD